MMFRRLPILAALLCASGLAACTSETGPTTAAPAPNASACTTDLSEFSGIIESDHATGNLAERVYAKMKPELTRAETACEAGRNAEALKMLAATKGRYGYR